MAARGIAKHTVLIVDDEPAVLEVWARILGDAGYRVVRAADAFDALSLMVISRPAVAVCDVHLPGPSGIWLAEMIRRHCPDTSVVLTSGDPFVQPREPLHDPIVACVTKPVCRADLLAAVRIGITWASEGTRSLS